MTTVRLADLAPLVDTLREHGYRVVGPTVRDGAIVLAELESAQRLPYGWGVTVEPGGYKLRPRGDRAAFGHAAGPQSWKQFLHPPKVPLWTARRDADGGIEVTEAREDIPRYAFLGVRGCDLRAIAIQDRVFGAAAHPQRGYGARRAAAFIVAVNCTEPAATCFCASTGSGPGATDGFDLALTELGDGDGYLVDVGSARGEQLLSAIAHAPAEAAVIEQARAAVAAAADQMPRSLPEGDLRDLLVGAREASRWTEVAQRCLTCGNCTMVCPTCFCTTVEDTTDLTGEMASRSMVWDSCFDLDFSYLHGGSVRPSTHSRYRQWLTHKLGAWHDQFGESGCVGCGRCIVWCPVGIDITEETHALAAEVRGK
jgi:ferredoxin